MTIALSRRAFIQPASPPPAAWRSRRSRPNSPARPRIAGRAVEPRDRQGA